jgi:hypothetical protein
VGSGVCGSITMMGLGMGGVECESRSARKRPTQPPPDMRIGRGTESEWPFVVVVLEVPFE